ncbi:MAG: TetR/AcrR family transcriptional regulator [Lachnospiraceae bacterium]|nr:TetR/AcrR family transcriptional regulator [Lachnospiraceae bacterium]
MKKGERRKQELLKIAHRMFIEKGYENTSIDEIIAEAGIAKGKYYYYFESKEATLEAVIDLMIEEAVDRAKEVEEAVPLLTEVVKEGISQGIVNCTNIEERVIWRFRTQRIYIYIHDTRSVEYEEYDRSP